MCIVATSRPWNATPLSPWNGSCTTGCTSTRPMSSGIAAARSDAVSTMCADENFNAGFTTTGYASCEAARQQLRPGVEHLRGRGLEAGRPGELAARRLVEQIAHWRAEREQRGVGGDEARDVVARRELRAHGRGVRGAVALDERHGDSAGARARRAGERAAAALGHGGPVAGARQGPHRGDRGARLAARPFGDQDPRAVGARAGLHDHAPAG